MVTKRSTTTTKRTTTAKKPAQTKTVKKASARGVKRSTRVDNFEPMKMTVVISLAAVSVLLLFGAIAYYN